MNFTFYIKCKVNVFFSYLQTLFLRLSKIINICEKYELKKFNRINFVK